jgi:long-chain acyl-CoA synthetase
MQKPWLAHYPSEVPRSITNCPLTLGELLPAAARRYPERAAVVLAVAAAGRLFTTSMTYARLERQVDAFAGALARLGVGKGDRVALYLPNCQQFVIGYLAAAKLGAISVPFNPLYSAREVSHQLRDCGAKVALVLSQFYPLVQQARAGSALTHVIVTRLKEYFPAPLWLLYTLTKERQEPRAPLAEGDLWLRDVLVSGAGAPKVSGSEHDTAVLLYTGGTTGISKGVELSHRNLIVNAAQNRVWARIGEGCETSLAALPLFHAFGLTCTLNVGLLTGATLVLVPNPRDIGGLVLTIEKLRPTVFPVVPTLLVAMSNLPGIERRDVRSVRVCPCAGSPLAASVQSTFIARTGIPAVEGYGLTEAAPVVMGNPPFGDDRHGTTGLPYPDTEVRIVDLETGQHDMAFDGDWTLPGEIIVKGPQVMKGYWNNPEETLAQLRQGWLHTGDIGQMHRDGYFRVVDRAKDMIIRSGMNIYPAEVEAVLLEHPKVSMALVIGVPDEVRGELVKAFVVPKPGAALAVEELLEHCRQNLAKYKVPSAIELRSELKMSAVGKPLRRALREELAA